MITNTKKIIHRATDNGCDVARGCENEKEEGEAKFSLMKKGLFIFRLVKKK